MARRVYLYGFDKLNRVVVTRRLVEEETSVQNMRKMAQWIKSNYPEHITIYAVNNRPGLYEEWRKTVKTRDFTVHFEFADTISREALFVV